MGNIPVTYTPPFVGQNSNGHPQQQTSPLADYQFQGGSVYDFLPSSYQQSREFAYQQYASDKEFERNIKLWQMNNDYNNPSAQAARLRAAGVSESAIAQMLAGNPQTASAASSGTPSVPGYNSSLNELFNPLANAQKIADVHRSAIENEYLPKTMESTVNKALSEIRYNSALSDLTSEQFDQLKKCAKFNIGKSAADLDIAIQSLSNLSAEYNRISAEIDKIKSDTQNVEESTKYKEYENEIQKWKKNFEIFCYQNGFQPHGDWKDNLFFNVASGKSFDTVVQSLTTLFTSLKNALNGDGDNNGKTPSQKKPSLLGDYQRTSLDFLLHLIGL